MKHPGTVTLSPATFLAVLADLIDSMVRAGFQNLLVLNGHGGNDAPCRAIWDQYLRRFQVNLQFLSYWELLTEEDARLLETRELPGHAQEFETSFALAAFAGNVRPECLDDQPDLAATKANADVGRELIHRIVHRTAERVEDMIAGRSVAPVPPFFP
jgi:creatinine amidohydrolase